MGGTEGDVMRQKIWLIRAALDALLDDFEQHYAALEPTDSPATKTTTSKVAIGGGVGGKQAAVGGGFAAGGGSFAARDLHAHGGLPAEAARSRRASREAARPPPLRVGRG